MFNSFVDSVNNLTTLEQLSECIKLKGKWTQASNSNNNDNNNTSEYTKRHRHKIISLSLELYLRKNYINEVDQVKHLVPLKDLEVLWLCDNPCVEDEKYYRCMILKYLPWLKKLDHQGKHYITLSLSLSFLYQIIFTRLFDLTSRGDRRGTSRIHELHE